MSRATLVTSIIEIIQKNILNHLGNQLQFYLYGHDSISQSDN